LIIIHEGVPGSGKSYDGIRKILDALQRERVVYTNIDGVHVDTCREFIASRIGQSRDWLDSHLMFLPANCIPDFWNHTEVGSLVVIDEAQLYFNSRDFIKTANREFGDWASTHRHHGYDLLLITQNAARIDTAVRSLAEFRYRYRKLNVFGSLCSKGYLIYTYAGEDPKHLSMRKSTYDVGIFPCYNSYVGDATEKKVIKLPNLLNHPIFYGLAVVLCLTIYFAKDSPLLHGKLINTPIADAAKAKDLSDSKPGIPTKLYKVERPPSAAGNVPLDLVVDVSASSGLVWLPLDAFMETSKGVFMTSGGYRLKHVESYDIDLMIAWVKPEFVPPPLRVVSSYN